MTERAEMHCEPIRVAAEPDTSVACAYCLTPFLPRRSWAKFCSTACRNEANLRKVDQGMRGVVSSVRIMRRGSVSVVLRFGLDERDRVLRLSPGDVFVGEKHQQEKNR